jgi:hypothetical protein
LDSPLDSTVTRALTSRAGTGFTAVGIENRNVCSRLPDFPSLGTPIAQYAKSTFQVRTTLSGDVDMASTLELKSINLRFIVGTAASLIVVKGLARAVLFRLLAGFSVIFLFVVGWLNKKARDFFFLDFFSSCTCASAALYSDPRLRSEPRGDMSQRCCALTGVFSASGEHKRCALTESGTTSFCVRYHQTPESRIFGTIWEHAKNCRACSKPVISTPLTVAPPHKPLPPAKQTQAPVSDVSSSATEKQLLPPPPRQSGTSKVGSAVALAKPEVVAEMPRLPPVNAILFTPVSAEARELEARFAGPSGIKLRVRVARELQPACWCAEPPEFTSCIDPLSVSSSQRVLALNKRLEAEDGEREERRELKRQQSNKSRAESRAASKASLTRSCVSSVAAMAASSKAAASTIITSPHSVSDSDSSDILFVNSTSAASTTACKSAILAVPSFRHGVQPLIKDVDTVELASMRALHRLALSSDLAFSPMNGDSWMTSTLIDAVAFEYVLGEWCPG